MGLIHYTTPSALTTFSFTAFGLASFVSGYKPFPKEFLDSGSCNVPENLGDQIHPRENKLRDLLSPYFYEYWFGNPEKPEEYLSFDKSCKKDKFLFLSAAEDHNGALDPKNMLGILKDINKKCDLKYKVVGSEKDIYWQVKKAAEMGKLTNIVINAHSDSQGMCLSKCESLGGWLSIYKNYTEGFKELNHLGRITLFGSKAGTSSDGNSKNNIAQKIATDSKREVIAPVDYISSSGVEVPNTREFELYQKVGDKKNNKEKKIFKLFQPIYEKCTNIAKNVLHPREKNATEAVKEETLKNSQLIYQDEFEKHILKICQDNPKQKFLFLSMENDHNGALNPLHNNELFEKISKNFDLKFKVVKTYEEICKEVKEASNFGEVVQLVINGHGNNIGIHIAGDSNDLNNWIHKYEGIKGYKNLQCLKNLPKSSKITLMSCKVAESENGNNNDNIANEIAKKTGKTVIAPTELFYKNRVKISSICQFDVFHPSEKDPKANIFKKFNPERVDDEK